ncbi:MAG TPA: NADH-quinone oxidoreductase subunit H [Candidatus Baltobacteraceae bacterium]|nr:NADH-quinone oxidoreductase subunit H [Candidatus Baltobacteraceae bacterium]
MTQSIALNLLQIAFVLLLSPLFAGILARCKELVQSKRGPSIFQPYRDLRKLFGKDERISEDSSWIFRSAPYFVFIVPLIVTLLIPVLTDFPLFFAFAGDMVGAGFILAISGMFFTLAAIDGGNPYGAMGASRTRMVGFLAEPVIIIVLFTVSFVANSTIPYIVQQHWVHPIANFFAPSHVLLLIAFFMVLLAETGRLPVDNPSGHFELAMVDESKALEFSGRSAALIKYGGYMKFVVLSIVFLNVLTTPWGLATNGSPAGLALAIALVAVKILALIAVIVAVESSYAKLRLFRISEFLAAAFVVSVTAMITEILHL